MNVSVITIGKTNHSEWSVKPKEKTDKRGKTFNMYYLESEDTKVLQKVKLRIEKRFESHISACISNDKLWKSDIIKTGISDNITVQTVLLPFETVRVNPLNLNPYICDSIPLPNRVEDFYDDYDPRILFMNGEEKTDNMIILLLGNDYRYIRSKVHDDNVSIISTFHTPTALGCVIRVGKGFDGTDIFSINAVKNDEFEYIKIVNNPDKINSVSVVNSIIKKPQIVNNLKNMDKRFERDKVSRRFIRASKELISVNYISALKFEESKEIVMRHDFDEAIDTDEYSCNIFPVNVDEKGFIIQDDRLKEAVEFFVKNKIKNICLIEAKLNQTTFKDVKPLYIFNLSKTDLVTKDYFVRCMKSN